MDVDQLGPFQARQQGQPQAEGKDAGWRQQEDRRQNQRDQDEGS